MLDGWTKASIGEIGTVVTGTTPATSSNSFYGGDIPFIAPGDLGNGLWVYRAEKNLTEEGLRAAKPVPEGAVLFTCIGATIGKAGVAARELATNQQINAVICNPKRADNLFVYYLLALRAESIKRLAGAQAVPIVNKSTFEDIASPLPPLPEQRKIAEILRTWDEAIEKLEALRVAKEQRLHSLREKLTYIDAEGEPIRLGDVTEELASRNGDSRLGREMVMGVTNSRGIVPMREQTIADDISRYKVVPHQAFAYNPMRINVGSIAMNEASGAILVSPDYVVFGCLHDQLSPDFLDHLRNTKWWAHYINSGGSGSVRKRTYYADLAAMKVPLPDFGRQRRIADILNTARRDVKATTCGIIALQRQKRGLMQKLLTGEWRVGVESPKNMGESGVDGT